MVTLKEIARKMRVSASTVSYALHPVLWKTKRIRPATRQAVLRHARRLGYRPHRAAVSLRTGRSRTLRVIVPTVASDLVSRMLEGLESALGGEFDLLLGVTGWDPAREVRFLDALGDRAADGAIVLSIGDRAALPSLRNLRRWKVPFVQVEHHFPEVPSDVVQPDNRGLAAMLTRHLLRLGRRPVYFLRSPRVHAGTLARSEGYEEAMREAGLVPRALPALPLSREGSRFEHYRAIADEVLREVGRPVGIVANDTAGMLASLEAAEAAGLRCPAEVSICGISAATARDQNDGVPFSRFLRRDFTRAEWSVEEMGRLAGSLLLRRLRGGRGARGPFERVSVPGRLVEAETAAPPAVSPAAVRAT
jgi:LacI family transcriptional regulator